MASENPTPGWDRDLTGAYVRVFVDDLLTRAGRVTFDGKEPLSIAGTVTSVGIDPKTLRPVLRIELHDDYTSATASPYAVLLLDD